MNISSIVVQTLPIHLEEVVENLKNCSACDYHLHDEKGKIIITIEGENLQEELAKLRVVEAIPNIISADMQMAYSEDELDEHLDAITKAQVVPNMLNDDTIDPSQIVYNGDLKKKDIPSFAQHFDDTK